MTGQHVYIPNMPSNAIGVVIVGYDYTAGRWHAEWGPLKDVIQPPRREIAAILRTLAAACDAQADEVGD